MNPDSSGGGELTALASLRRFVRPRTTPRKRCEQCDAGLSDEHDHLVEIATRKLSCACEACANLFSGQAGTRFRRVPRRGLPTWEQTMERLLSAAEELSTS
ncbi:MAG: DUF5947 family protein [Isosphaeraceae bacterium]